VGKDKIIRIIGFIFFIISVIIYNSIETGRTAAFVLGLFTGLGFVTIFAGQRIIGKTK